MVDIRSEMNGPDKTLQEQDRKLIHANKIRDIQRKKQSAGKDDSNILNTPKK